MKASVLPVLYAFLLLTQSVYGKEREKFSTMNYVKDTLYKWSQNENIKFGVKTVAVAGASIAAAPVVLSAAGFGAAGVAAGSVAASAQGMFLGGSVSGLSGAVFGALQSLGAAGLGVGAKATIVGVSAAGVKGYETVKSKLFGKDESDEKSIPSKSVHGTSENEKFSYWKTIKDTVSGLSQDECIRLSVKTAGIAAATMVAAPVVLSAAGFGAAAGTVAAGAKYAILGGSINGFSCAISSAFQSQPQSEQGATPRSKLSKDQIVKNP